MARLKSCYSCAKFKMFEPCEMRKYQTDGACWVAPDIVEAIEGKSYPVKESEHQKCEHGNYMYHACVKCGRGDGLLDNRYFVRA